MNDNRVALEELPSVIEELNDKPIDEIIDWSIRRFGDKTGFMTAFGYSGTVLMHYLYKMNVTDQVEIAFIDTGYHFPETLEFAQKLQEQWNLRLTILQPREGLKDIIMEDYGPDPWNQNPNLCCHYNKVDPLLRVLPTKDAWFSGLRRDQSYTRNSIDVAEIDGRGTFRLYPLAYWTKKDIWKYINYNNIPYHPLIDQGYMSIGCSHCTLPVKEGGDERDGRWKATQKMECGLHLTK